MTEHSLVHHTFTVERSYPVPVDTVFAAWSDAEGKRKWFATEGSEHDLDFRVGGREVTSSQLSPDNLVTFESLYLDIIDGSRIVYSSTLSSNGKLSTASITSVEFRSDGDGTTLVLIESDVFIDGQELPEWREQGTADQLTKLGETLG